MAAQRKTNHQSTHGRHEIQNGGTPYKRQAFCDQFNLHWNFVSIENLSSDMFVSQAFLVSACLKKLNFGWAGGNSGQESQVALYQMPCPLGSTAVLCRGIELPSSPRGG